MCNYSNVSEHNFYRPHFCYFYRPHPYIFFNHDRVSMTFLGFRLNQNGDLLDPGSNKPLETSLMNPTLRGQLNAQGVDFDADYEIRDRLA